MYAYISHEYLVLQRSEEGVVSSGAGVIDGSTAICHMGAEN